MLEGSTGSGKTHLAAAIVNAIIDRGSPAKYISALDIPDMLRNERFEDDDAESGSFESLLDAPTLVIDDLGAQTSATNWVDSQNRPTPHSPLQRPRANCDCPSQTRIRDAERHSNLNLSDPSLIKSSSTDQRI